VVRAPSDKRDFFGVSLGFLMFGGGFPRDGWLRTCIHRIAFLAR
jgi:hypothetical protein